MEGGGGNWTRHLHFDWQSPNLSSFGAPLDMGEQNGISAFMNPGVNMASGNEKMPVFASSELPHWQLGRSSNEPHGWFYCLPRFRQSFMPSPNFTVEEKLPVGHVKDFKEEIPLRGESSFPQKQFLVIDQSGTQTTFIYSSGLGSPAECLACWDSKLHGPNNMNGNEPSRTRENLNDLIGRTLTDEVDENQETDVQSEMHEDTEEINALLYSDSDGYSAEDDEVTSTGHSPSTMTTHDNEEIFKESPEEVASSAGKSKKRKISDSAYNDIDMQLMDTASSLNLNRPFEIGDDAESRCSSGDSRGSGEMGTLSVSKKMRKERIRDVLSNLQSIIPGGKDKDPIVLLDEAIRCLKSLKLRARVLGLDAL
ncbi:hypothetical protein L6164_016014 [Bauhinia variegata]|uniref:Uncharacterized protein n=1 Tax=Bauhinia variegata TaxID=167791 RepID=A0ACB9NSU0_BAUVA|nr:hypothetical protein L6164_016014 [Bauhinia variegata]